MDGGFFRGNANRPTVSEMNDENSTIRRYPAVLWGYVVREPKVTCINTKRVEFTVKFGAGSGKAKNNKEASGYRNCEAWGDTAVSAVMTAVEHKETVVCFGEWKVVKYAEGNLTKKGKQKQDYNVFTCHAVYPMHLMEFLVELYNSPTIQKILEEDRNDAPDPFESLGDEIIF